LEEAYRLIMNLKHIYHTTTDKGVAFIRLVQWFRKVEETVFVHFNTVKNSVAARYKTILNFFDNRSPMLLPNLSTRRLKLSEPPSEL
jgi:hypothetical protein